jgi:hypothetical protein
MPRTPLPIRADIVLYVEVESNRDPFIRPQEDRSGDLAFAAEAEVRLAEVDGEAIDLGVSVGWSTCA